jgi:hypothetical protein
MIELLARSWLRMVALFIMIVNVLRNLRGYSAAGVHASGLAQTQAAAPISHPPFCFG